MSIIMLNEVLKGEAQPKYLEQKFLKSYKEEMFSFYLTPREVDVVTMVLFNVHNMLSEQLEESSRLTEEGGFMDILLSAYKSINDNSINIC